MQAFLISPQGTRTEGELKIDLTNQEGWPVQTQDLSPPWWPEGKSRRPSSLAPSRITNYPGSPSEPGQIRLYSHMAETHTARHSGTTWAQGGTPVTRGNDTSPFETRITCGVRPGILREKERSDERDDELAADQAAGDAAVSEMVDGGSPRQLRPGTPWHVERRTRTT